MQNQVQDGRVLTFLESELLHPTHGDGLVNAGDPALVGRLAGIAYESAAATTELIDLQMDGVYNLSVTTVHGVSKGETVYADTSAVLSDDYTGVPFGTALGAVVGGATTTIPVRLFGATPGAVGFGS